MSKQVNGKVYLVGAGPGDPGLLTLRAAQLLASADTVVYDRLIHPDVLKHARSRARLLFVGNLAPVKGVPCLIDAFSRGTFPKEIFYAPGMPQYRAAWDNVIAKGEVLVNREREGTPEVSNNVYTSSVVVQW